MKNICIRKLEIMVPNHGGDVKLGAVIGRLCMDDDIVINVSGIHHHPQIRRRLLRRR